MTKVGKDGREPIRVHGFLSLHLYQLRCMKFPEVELENKQVSVVEDILAISPLVVLQNRFFLLFYVARTSVP